MDDFGKAAREIMFNEKEPNKPVICAVDFSGHYSVIVFGSLLMDDKTMQPNAIIMDSTADIYSEEDIIKAAIKVIFN